MNIGHATGLQTAFLMYAVMLLAVPLSAFVISSGQYTGNLKVLIETGAHFGLAAIVIASFPRLRRFAWDMLSVPIPKAKRSETILVALADLAHAFATVAGLALWFWITQGPERVEKMVVNVDRELAKAFSDPGLIRLLLSVLVAPVVEELVFRGFIFRAFERQWGAWASMLATSAVFGLYHTYFWSAFVGSIIYTCVFLRTGSLRGPILVHMLFNLMLWWPLLGQHVFPHGAPLSDPATWYFHFACLAFVIVALPIYVWMSRDRHVVAPTVFLEPNAALPK